MDVIVHQVLVVVSDAGLPVKSASLDIMIKVVRNLHGPMFIDTYTDIPFSYLSQVDTVLLTVQAEDKDSSVRTRSRLRQIILDVGVAAVIFPTIFIECLTVTVELYICPNIAYTCSVYC